MNVLFNALQAGNRSGTGVYTTQLAARMPAFAGDDSVTAVWPAHLPLPPQCADSSANFQMQEINGRGARIWYDQWGIRRDIRAVEADVVHYPANVGSVLPMRNMVITIHDLTFFHNPSWYRYERAQYYRWSVTRSARLASRIITVSTATAIEICKILSVPADRIDVVHNGVDERFTPRNEGEQRAARNKYRLPDRYVLFVGTIEPRKNVARIIRAWSQIASDIKEDLVIAGREGWKVGPIHQEAELAGQFERIHFPGYIENDDLPAIMSGATALIYPSLYEGFGIPVAEAMACGLPVLTSNVSSLPEIAGDAALTLDPTDVDGLAEGIRNLASDEALRSELSRKGFEQAKRYEWSRAAQQTLASYKRMLGI
jgi:glycosyltransferase involved in cell wall biosynthesis